MDNASDGGGGLSPDTALRPGSKNVEDAARMAELDAQVARLYESATTASSDLHLGVEEHDPHRVIVGLRRLLAIGYMAKMLADEIEATLPQWPRLFDPPRIGA